MWKSAMRYATVIVAVSVGLTACTMDIYQLIDGPQAGEQLFTREGQLTVFSECNLDT
ncbi:MAG TPA: hypothetical protein VNP04_27300 [Alphaproteobacteria bacterium]|nr:hypothetical protein [Alphaproteobacteria bacterium]